jgi:hypothetical protein
VARREGHVALSFAPLLEEYKRKKRKSSFRDEVRGGLENCIKGRGSNRGGREKKEVTRKERRGNVLFSILLASPPSKNPSCSK